MTETDDRTPNERYEDRVSASLGRQVTQMDKAHVADAVVRDPKYDARMTLYHGEEEAEAVEYVLSIKDALEFEVGYYHPSLTNYKERHDLVRMPVDGGMRVILAEYLKGNDENQNIEDKLRGWFGQRDKE